MLIPLKCTKYFWNQQKGSYLSEVQQEMELRCPELFTLGVLFCFLLNKLKIRIEYTLPFVSCLRDTLRRRRWKKKSALKLIVNPLKAGTTPYLSHSFSFPCSVQWFTCSKYSVKLERQSIFQFTLIWRGCTDLRSSWDEKQRLSPSWLLASEAHTVLKTPLPKLACIAPASLIAGHCGILSVLTCFRFCWREQDDSPMAVFPGRKCERWLEAGT